MTITNPIRQMNTRQTAEIRAGLYSELPAIIVERKVTVASYSVEFMPLASRKTN